MPELPDVETMRRHLQAEAVGRRIEGVAVPDPLVLRGLAPAALDDALAGKELTDTLRWGKWLFAAAAGAGPWLLLHFGMTGSLAVVAPGVSAPDHTRVRFRFADGGSMCFRDQRRFGRVGLVDDPRAFARSKRLGPDALDRELTERVFADRLGKRRGVLKGVLLDQGFVAGLGNIYADEVCHEGRIGPFSRVEHLRAEDVRRLFHAMRQVLGTAVRAEADASRFPKSWLLAARHPGGCCDCGGEVARRRFEGRYTYWCPRCQPDR